MFLISAEVETYFPGLWQYLGYPRHAQLPPYNQRYFSKSVWDAEVSGVPAIVNWVISYPSLLDALTGGGAGFECELSIRVQRRKAEEVDCGKNRCLEPILKDVARACEALHDAGWDTGVHGGARSAV